MPRSSPYRIELSDEERVALESLARSYTLPYWRVTRARMMMLLAADGLRNDQIATRLNCRREVVSQWRNASDPLITLYDVEKTKPRVLANLDSDFFRLRSSRLTASERNYVQAMAELPEGQRATGEIARKLDRSQQELSVVRERLIRKGVLDSAGQGYVEFTVPGYDSYLQRQAARQSRGARMH